MDRITIERGTVEWIVRVDDGERGSMSGFSTRSEVRDFVDGLLSGGAVIGVGTPPRDYVGEIAAAGARVGEKIGDILTRDGPAADRRTVAGGGKLKLRAGGWYRSRCGKVCGPLEFDARKDVPFPFAVPDPERVSFDTSWVETGAWYQLGEPDDLDLVEEVDPPASEGDA